MTAAAAALAGELAFHRRMARPGLLVDVGAHVGAFSFAMAELPSVEVLAFEPLPHAYATLAEHAAAKPSVRTLPLGLSHREGRATLSVPHLRDGPVWVWERVAQVERTRFCKGARVAENKYRFYLAVVLPAIQLCC